LKKETLSTKVCALVCLHNQVFVYPTSFYLEGSSPSVAHCGLHNVWPIQRHFFLVICCSVGICFILCHNSSFEIVTGYLTFQYVVGIFLQALGVNHLSI